MIRLTESLDKFRTQRVAAQNRGDPTVPALDKYDAAVKAMMAALK